TGFDPNAFTVTHKDPGGTPFRVTVIGMVDEGGVTRLRADSTFAGATYRHEQTQPAAGTLVLESGRVEGGVFTGLRRKTHAVTEPEPGTQVQRDTEEERADGVSAYQATRDVESTWVRFLWGWEKTEEVMDPEGEALTSSWTYYQPGE